MRAFAPFVLVALVGLAACGGGGDSNAPPAPTPPQGQLSPSQLEFGRIAIGQASGPRSAVLTNVGEQPLVIDRYEYSGQIANFQINHNCPQTLAPGASCTATFVCAPVETFADDATVYVYHNGSRLGGDLAWHLQTYSFVTLVCFT